MQVLFKFYLYKRCNLGYFETDVSVENGNYNCLQCSINCTSCINNYDQCEMCAG